MFSNSFLAMSENRLSCSLLRYTEANLFLITTLIPILLLHFLTHLPPTRLSRLWYSLFYSQRLRSIFEYAIYRYEIMQPLSFCTQFPSQITRLVFLPYLPSTPLSSLPLSPLSLSSPSPLLRQCAR